MRGLILGAAAVGVFVVLPACSGGYNNPNPTTPGATGPITITIVGERGAQSFTPNPASAAGQLVVFKNNDTIVHRVLLNDANIDTGDIAPGATSRAVAMPAAGTNYHCTVHPAMVGAVGGSTTPPPTCTGQYC